MNNRPYTEQNIKQFVYLIIEFVHMANNKWRVFVYYCPFNQFHHPHRSVTSLFLHPPCLFCVFISINNKNESMIRNSLTYGTESIRLPMDGMFQLTALEFPIHNTFNCISEGCIWSASFANQSPYFCDRFTASKVIQLI